MVYHGEFQNPQEAVASIIVHMAALDVDLVSATVNQSIVVIETNNPFPEEQLDHLGLAAV